MTKRILIAGESWTVHSIHQKGFDSFTTTEYAEGVRWLKAALEKGGWEVTFQPSHVAARDFPFTAEELAAYDVVLLSDIGANTLLLHPETFTKSKVLPNRLVSIRDYVEKGGGLVMVGGYLTFQGIDAKAQYAGSPIEEALPVTIEKAMIASKPRRVLNQWSPMLATPSSPALKRPGQSSSATTALRPRQARRWSPVLARIRSSLPAISARAAVLPSPPIAARTGRRRLSSIGPATKSSGRSFAIGPQVRPDLACPVKPPYGTMQEVGATAPTYLF